MTTPTAALSVELPHALPLPEPDFWVPGIPVPYTRMTQRTVYARDQYGTPTAKAKAAMRYLAYKDEVGYRARLAYEQPHDGPLRLWVMVNLIHPDKRRFDLSNCVKGIEDGMNKIAFHDDRQIVLIHAVVVPSVQDVVLVAVRPVQEAA